MADIGIKISATDAASGVFKSVATEAGKLQGAIGSVSSSIGAFATTAVAGLAVLTFASQIKQAIDLADSFNKLSQKTGVAVDDLSKLNYAAGLADVGTDALAAGLKKLNLNISAAASGSKEQAALFKSLGVSIQDAQGNALSADKVFAQLADKFSQSADGANKTAVAVALLGKNGADLVPLLNGGSQALKDLGDEAAKLGIVLGPDFAKKAEDFNDNLHKISLAGQGLAVSLGDNLVTLLGEMSSEMAKAAVESGKLAAVWAGFETFWYGPKLLQANKLMLEQTEKLTSAETALANARASGNANAIRWQQTRVDWLKTEIAKTTELRNTLESDKTKKTASAAAAPTQDSAAIKSAAAALHTTAKAVSTLDDAFVAGRTAAKDWAKSFEDFRKIAAEAAAETDGLSKAQAQLLTYLGSNGYTNASEPMRQLALAEAYAAINAEELAKATKQSAKEALEAVNSYADSVEAQQKAADTLREQVVAEREHVAAIGLSTEALAELVAAKYEDQAVSKERLATIADTVDATGLKAQLYRQEAKDLRELAALKRSGALKETIVEANKKIDEENKRTAEKLESAITDGLMRGFENGKPIAENFRDTVENMFKTMVLRPVVQATVNTGLGALGIPGVGGAGGGSGGGLLNTASNAYGLYNKASSFFGGGASSAFGFAGLAGAGNAAGLSATLPALNTLAIESGVTSMGTSIFSLATPTTTGVTLGTLAPSLGAAGTTTLGTTVTAPLAGGAAPALGIPGIGWAIGGALLLAGLLGSGGGRYVQSTGETSLNFDESGKETSRAAYRFRGIDEATAKEYGMKYVDLNEGANNFATSLNKTYLSAAKSLGITAAASNFAYGGNDADSSTGQGKFRLGAGVVGGKSYFNSGEIAKSDEALKLAASRAVLTALSGSEMPKYLAGVFDSAGDIATNSQAQIDAVLATAQSFKALHDSLDQLPFDSLKDQTYAVYKALTDAAGGLEQFGQKLSGYYDNFYSAEEKRTQTLKGISKRLADGGINVGVDALEKMSRADFRALFETIQTTFTGQASTGMVAALLDVQGAFASVTAASADAATALATTRKALLDAATGAASSALAGLTKSVEAQKTALTSAYDLQVGNFTDQLTNVTTSVSKLQSLASSLKGTLDGLRIAGSDGQYRSAAQSQISSALATARSGGGLPLDGQLTNALQTVSRPSEQLFATFTDYARDFYKTANDIAALSDLTGAQLTAGEAMQGLLQDQIDLAKRSYDAQVSGLDEIATLAQSQLDAANGTYAAILSLSDAIKASTAATQDLLNARGQQGLATGAVVGGGLQSVKPDVARLDSINTYVNTLDFSEAGAANSVRQLYAAAQQYGVNQSELAAATGYRLEDVQKLFTKYGIPAFAVGTNYIPNDMVAMLHEGEAVVPKAYNPAAGGDSNSALLDEMRAMRAEIAALRASAADTADNTKRTASTLVNVTRGGEAMQTQVFA